MGSDISSCNFSEWMHVLFDVLRSILRTVVHEVVLMLNACKICEGMHLLADVLCSILTGVVQSNRRPTE